MTDLLNSSGDSNIIVAYQEDLHKSETGRHGGFREMSFQEWDSADATNMFHSPKEAQAPFHIRKATAIDRFIKDKIDGKGKDLTAESGRSALQRRQRRHFTSERVLKALGFHSLLANDRNIAGTLASAELAFAGSNLDLSNVKLSLEALEVKHLFRAPGQQPHFENQRWAVLTALCIWLSCMQGVPCSGTLTTMLCRYMLIK
jgi:hypothetical protein